MARRTFALTLASMWLVAASSWAQVCTEQSPSTVSLARRWRQLSLDLLGRPPTVEEYRQIAAKGDITDEAIAGLLEREDFYARMKGYHRALLRSNISGSIFTNGDTRLYGSSDGLKPLELRGVPTGALRGKIGVGCAHTIEQDACATQHEDPNLEPTSRSCRDERGVPLPVAVDYNTDYYDCTALPGAASCADAAAKGLVPAKHFYYCDMRTIADGGMAPFHCGPRGGNPTTAAMTQELTEDGGRVIAFQNPAPQSAPAPCPGGVCACGTKKQCGASCVDLSTDPTSCGACGKTCAANQACVAGVCQLARLDRCTTTLGLQSGIKGRYQPQLGCVQKDGVVVTPAPAWATTTAPTAMCAIEAQSRDVNPWTLESCETGRFSSDRSCGCGVKSRRCEPGSGALHNARIAAFNEEPLVLADSVLRRNEDYFTLLTTPRSFVNGTLSQLFREDQSPTLWPVSSPAERQLIPDVPIAATDTWVEYTRGPGASGVLTTASWLLRFPTHRARANQFWGAFLCKSFAPPAGAVAPSPTDNCNRENNLAKRCGCSGCHATIEPTGAHWGRFGQRNAVYLDPELYPRFSAKCRDCALSGDLSCDGQCANYIMQALDAEGAKDLGMLSTYLYRTAEEEPNIAAGPKLLVESALQGGELEQCAVRNVWNHLLGRPMTSEEERLYLKSLTDTFAAHHHDLKQLMLEVVKTEAYRRVD